MVNDMISLKYAGLVNYRARIWKLHLFVVSPMKARVIGAFYTYLLSKPNFSYPLPKACMIIIDCSISNTNLSHTSYLHA